MNELKIDRSLVRGIPADACSGDAAQFAISLGRHLELKVIAAGVESAVQASHLAGMDCKFGQGHFFAPTLSPEQAGQFLCQHRPQTKATAPKIR